MGYTGRSKQWVVRRRQNGKGLYKEVVLNVILHIILDYRQTSPIDVSQSMWKACLIFQIRWIFSQVTNSMNLFTGNPSGCASWATKTQVKTATANPPTAATGATNSGLSTAASWYIWNNWGTSRTLTVRDSPGPWWAHAPGGTISYWSPLWRSCVSWRLCKRRVVCCNRCYDMATAPKG